MEGYLGIIINTGIEMNRNRFSCVLLVLATVAMLSCIAHAQRPIATVKINTEKLIQESKEKLNNLKLELETYVKEFDWSDNSKRYDIPVQIDIFFERAQTVSFEDRYDARMVLSNGTDFQASDKRWSFRYIQGTTTKQSGQFEPLTAMLDFYIYVMLAHEYDKATKLGGDDYFQKAYDIMQQSKFSEFYSGGWKERSLYLENLMSEGNIPLRELEYFFIQAKQWLRLDNRKTGSQYLRVILMRLLEMDPEKDGLDRFYQLHHLDLARMLSSLQMRQELLDMIRLNPDNEVIYKQFMDQIIKEPGTN
ncbi:hypothetical protein CEE37_10890 [candidate division LCP-89 bacterium B3_LCP]|uniref:DUF4835 domain-containing protein n=1 Tax=candidate division LCP-89 bacterium B3_LCP TaxID=2012998 RepID=A0A532UXW8_UNCL8|nr:MAG: hypothetical protein CEE37_10890 [candidate division LCP-89 bacterium B3_LCP]